MYPGVNSMFKRLLTYGTRFFYRGLVPKGTIWPVLIAYLVSTEV
jgi:hypothetical protein